MDKNKLYNDLMHQLKNVQPAMEVNDADKLTDNVIKALSATPQVHHKKGIVITIAKITTSAAAVLMGIMFLIQQNSSIADENITCNTYYNPWVTKTGVPPIKSVTTLLDYYHEKKQAANSLTRLKEKLGKVEETKKTYKINQGFN